MSRKRVAQGARRPAAPAEKPMLSGLARTPGFERCLTATRANRHLSAGELADLLPHFDALDGFQRRALVNIARAQEASRTDGRRQWWGELKDATPVEWIRLTGGGQVPETVEAADERLAALETRLGFLQTTLDGFFEKACAGDTDAARSHERLGYVKKELEVELAGVASLRRALSTLRRHGRFEDTSVVVEVGVRADVFLASAGVAVGAKAQVRPADDEKRAQTYVQVDGAALTATGSLGYAQDEGRFTVHGQQLGPVGMKYGHPVRGDEARFTLVPSLAALQVSDQSVGFRLATPFAVRVEASVGIADPRLSLLREGAAALLSGRGERAVPEEKPKGLKAKSVHAARKAGRATAGAAGSTRDALSDALELRRLDDAMEATSRRELEAARQPSHLTRPPSDHERVLTERPSPAPGTLQVRAQGVWSGGDGWEPL